MKCPMRMLLLAGIVTLTNLLGSVVGNTNDLLAGEPDAAPVKTTVTTSNAFAVDLYHQMAKENAGKNVGRRVVCASPVRRVGMVAAQHQGVDRIGGCVGKLTRLNQETLRTDTKIFTGPWDNLVVTVESSPFFLSGFGELARPHDRDAAQEKLASRRQSGLVTFVGLLGVSAARVDSMTNADSQKKKPGKTSLILDVKCVLI